jgi:hypothetical protein
MQRGFATKVREHAYGNLGREAVRSAAMAEALRALLAALNLDHKA